jgi:hypothetical protein
MKKLTIIFLAAIIISGCESKSEKVTFTCNYNYSLEFYDVNSSVLIYTKDNNSMSKYTNSDVYNAKWDDVNSDKMLESLENKKNDFKTSFDTTEYDITTKGKDIYQTISINMTDDNVNNFDESLLDSGKVSVNKYVNYLISNGYNCTKK